MNRKILTIVIAAAGLLTGSCNRSANQPEKPVITVSIEPQRWLLERIAGDRFEVNSLMARGGNPESYEPSFADLAKLESSACYIKVGHLPFEAAIIEKIRSNRPDLKIVDSSDSIELISDDHGHDHGVDPHVWNSPRNVRIMAGNMLGALKAIDPDGAAVYDANFAALSASIDSVDALCASILAPVSGETFIVWHPSLSYFARDYGLHQLAVGAEGKEHSVDDTRKIVNHIAEHGASVFLVQKDFDTSKADVIARSGGNLRVETINPLNYDWDSELVETARAIAGH
ncbi:MAG: zinc ABC transporter substrate-binding protein [Muribaculaceae bacterium]|nr:zinc ABC transporter substrate-binding protein [Muribaculaceae bacterium]